MSQKAERFTQLCENCQHASQNRMRTDPRRLLTWCHHEAGEPPELVRQSHWCPTWESKK